MPLIQPDPQNAGAVRRLFSSIAARYDLANHVLSAGLDFLWRRQAVQLVARWKPVHILDLATGSGDLALAISAACPVSRVVAADFCFPMLREAARKNVANLVTADGMRLPFATGAFDAVTIAFGLRNMESWPLALREISRVIRPGGWLLVLDFSVPPAPLRWIYRPYLHHLLPRLAALLTRERAAYAYLGDSIERFPSGEAMCRLIASAGCESVTHRTLSGGIAALYAGRRTGATAGVEAPRDP